MRLLFEIEEKESQKLKTCQKLQAILDKQELTAQSAADRTKAVHKSEVEELHTHQNLETGHCNI